MSPSTKTATGALKTDATDATDAAARTAKGAPGGAPTGAAGADARTEQSANAPLRQLSPLRKTTSEDSIPGLVEEQLRHFAVDPEGDYGRSLARLTASLYEGNLAVHELWRTTLATIEELPRADRIALFNAKRFASFQLAKILDNLQNPFRAAHQSLMGDMQTDAAQGSYPVFDNVPALFSSTPVITRTSTYIYACMEWGEDAFKGQESLSPIYSRLLNPTAISLANYIVDLEAGRSTRDYLAWNFNSGMAAVDALLGMLLKSGDIVVASRNVYGGVYQLLEDWYAKPDKLGVAVEWVDGCEGEDFARAIDRAKERHAGRLERGGLRPSLSRVALQPARLRLGCPRHCPGRPRAGLLGRLRLHRRHPGPAASPAPRRPGSPARLRYLLLHQRCRRLRLHHRRLRHRPGAVDVRAQGRRLPLARARRQGARDRVGRDHVLECLLCEGRLLGRGQSVRGASGCQDHGPAHAREGGQHAGPRALLGGPPPAQCPLARRLGEPQPPGHGALPHSRPAPAALHGGL